MEKAGANRSIEPFDPERHSREGFSCGVDSLDRYFRLRANQDRVRRVAAVFVLTDGSAVLGFYTLSSYTIDLGELPEEAARRLPKYPLLPATLIGRHHAQSRVGALASGCLTSPRDRPLGARNLQARLVPERRQRQHVEIPGYLWPASQFMLQVGFEVGSETGRSERSALQLAGRQRGRKHLRLKMRAAHQQDCGQQKPWPK